MNIIAKFYIFPNMFLRLFYRTSPNRVILATLVKTTVVMKYLTRENEEEDEEIIHVLVQGYAGFRLALIYYNYKSIKVNKNGKPSFDKVFM